MSRVATPFAGSHDRPDSPQDRKPATRGRLPDASGRACHVDDSLTLPSDDPPIWSPSGRRERNEQKTRLGRRDPLLALAGQQVLDDLPVLQMTARFCAGSSSSRMFSSGLPSISSRSASAPSSTTPSLPG